MEKDFDNWNKNKKIINKQSFVDFYHKREIWWCTLGVNIGFEQDGTGKNFDRPVIIIKGFSKNVFICLPLTGKKKNGKYYFYLGKINGRESTALLSQIRLVDTKRLIKKIGMLDQKLFDKLKTTLQKVIFN